MDVFFIPGDGELEFRARTVKQERPRFLAGNKGKNSVPAKDWRVPSLLEKSAGCTTDLTHLPLFLNGSLVGPFKKRSDSYV